MVEINPRYTMGRVALELARFDLSAEGVSLTVAPVGKGPPGAICLTPCFKQTRWAAYLMEDETVRDTLQSGFRMHDLPRFLSQSQDAHSSVTR